MGGWVVVTLRTKVSILAKCGHFGCYDFRVQLLEGSGLVVRVRVWVRGQLGWLGLGSCISPMKVLTKIEIRGCACMCVSGATM